MIDTNCIEKVMARKAQLLSKDTLTDKDIDELRELNERIDEWDQLRQESIAWLRNFMTEVNTQDNRITATPYYYTLRCPKQVFGVKVADDYIWVDRDSEEIYNPEEEAVELLQQSEMEELKCRYGAILPVGDLPQRSKDVTDRWLIIAAEEGGWTKQWYRMSEEHKGVFFTEKAIFKHLEENKHHYPAGTDTYVEHAYRNPELRNLLEHIGKLVEVPYERK